MDVNKQSPIELSGNNGAYQSVHHNKLNKPKITNNEALSQEQIDKLLDALPVRAFQARRFVQFLGKNPNSKTADCNVAVAGVNLSDIAKKYNLYIRSKGYELKCRLPQRLIKNRFGEETMQHLWCLAEVNQEEVA